MKKPELRYVTEGQGGSVAWKAIAVAIIALVFLVSLSMELAP